MICPGTAEAGTSCNKPSLTVNDPFMTAPAAWVKATICTPSVRLGTLVVNVTDPAASVLGFSPGTPK
jgi:hypothetical protein